MSIVKTPSGKRAFYYYGNWTCYEARKFPISSLPIEKISDLVYSFFALVPKADGKWAVESVDPWADFDKRYTNEGVRPFDSWNNNGEGMYGSLGQLAKLKAAGHKFNVHCGLGGWSLSKNYSDAMLTEIGRKSVAESLIALFKRYPIFSGVSVDFEYVSNNGINYGLESNVVRKEDAQNVLTFIHTLRAAFKANGMGHYEIGFCTSADPEKIHLPLKEYGAALDRLEIMSYDHAAQSWGGTVTAHHTNPLPSKHSKLSAKRAVEHFLAAGVPSEKIYIGVAFYGRSWGGTDGFGKPAKAGEKVDSQFPEEPGVLDYRCLPLPGATEYVDKESGGCFSYDPVKRICNTFDGVASVLEKCKMVNQYRLGGCLIWEISGDVRDSNHPRSLVKCLYENLTHVKGIAPVPVPVPSPGQTPIIGPSVKPTVKPTPTVLKPVTA